jgi:hypothetical protein
MPLVPIIGILLKGFLAIYLYRFSPRAWFLAAGWIIVGLGLFLAYARGRLREAERPRIARERETTRREEKREILVPVSEESPGESEPRVAAALARAREVGVVALNVVQVPRQTSLRAAAGLSRESGDLVAKLERFAKSENLTLTSRVAVGHAISPVIGEVAAAEEISTVVLGWRGQSTLAASGEASLTPCCTVRRPTCC